MCARGDATAPRGTDKDDTASAARREKPVFFFSFSFSSNRFRTILPTTSSIPISSVRINAAVTACEPLRIPRATYNIVGVQPFGDAHTEFSITLRIYNIHNRLPESEPCDGAHFLFTTMQTAAQVGLFRIFTWRRCSKNIHKSIVNAIRANAIRFNQIYYNDRAS